MANNPTTSPDPPLSETEPEDSPETRKPLENNRPPVEFNIGLAPVYTAFYWFSILAFGILTLGLGFLLLPIFLWYKKAILNRTRIIYTDRSNRITVQRGNWFVRDDDVVLVTSIDNVKLDRTLAGKIFGWIHLTIETRSENYTIKYVSAAQAKDFQDRVLA